MRAEKRKNPFSDWLVLAGVLAVAATLSLVFPDRRGPSVEAFSRNFVEMLAIMPAVLVIMGLFSAWVPREAITRHLGQGSGARGMAIALAFGTLPTGPLYAAFPLAKELLGKGASPANVFVFLAAWGCIKIPQELVELRFLGWRFTLARLVFTVAVVAAMAPAFQRLLGKKAETAEQDV